MKIVKHGKNVQERIITCPVCGCEFIPLDTEILKDGNNKYVYCPECVPTKENRIYISAEDKNSINQDQLADFIVNNLDIYKIHTAMLNLNWKWINSNGVPTQEIIRNTAKSLVKEALKEKTDITSGGFHVMYVPEDESGKEGAKIYFTIDESGAFIDNDNKIEFF